MAYLEKDKLQGGKNSRSVGVMWKFLMVGIVFFGITVFIYGGIALGYNILLKAQISDIDMGLEVLNKRISEEEQQKVGSFYSRLSNIMNLLNKHTAISSFFTLLEKNTNQGVYFTGLSLSVKENQIKLNGKAKSYTELIQQMKAFEIIPEITQVKLNSANRKDDGKVEFSLQLFLSSKILLVNK